MFEENAKRKTNIHVQTQITREMAYDMYYYIYLYAFVYVSCFAVSQAKSSRFDFSSSQSNRAFASGWHRWHFDTSTTMPATLRGPSRNCVANPL